MTEISISDFIQKLPKAELHVHLEGSISPETVLALAERHDMLHTLPVEDEIGLKEWFKFSDFPHFLQIYLLIQDLLRTSDDFSIIAYELGRDMAEQNIKYREVTFTPYTHTDYSDKGLLIQDILLGLEEGRQKAQEKFDVEIRWVFDVGRNLSFDNNGNYNPEPAETTLDYALLGQDFGVVGFGLGGNEVNAPPEPFAHAFERAVSEGLWSVPHAGETMGPESVWGAINKLKAKRIGHGVRAIEDATLIQALMDRGIVLEVNPTSNICLNVYDSFDEHPLRKLDEAGVIVTVNSDDPLLFSTTLIQEYAILVKHFGYDQDKLIRVARNAFEYAAVDKNTKNKLLIGFESELLKLTRGTR